MNRLMLMAMGGYGDMGMMEAAAGGGGVIESLKAKLSFLPGWASILVIAVLVILAAMLVGWIGGKIIGSILYPDPEKQSILSKKQKFLVLGGAVAAVALTIFALTYTPAPEPEEDPLPVGGEMTDGELPEGELPEGEDGTVEEEPAVEPDEEIDAVPEAGGAINGANVWVGGGTAVAIPMG